MAFGWLFRRLGLKPLGTKEIPDGIARMLQLTFAGREALAQGHANQALSLLKEKHELVIEYWGKEAVFTATSAVDLADAYLACGETSEADKLLEWALDRYHELEVNDERLLNVEMNWAMSAYLAANYASAETRFLALIARLRADGVQHDHERAVALDYLAQVYLRQSRTKDAELLLLDALAIFERDGTDPGATAVCLSLLARLRYTEERFREAEQLQRRAIGIYESSDQELSLAKELDHLGASLAMRAQLEQRAELAEEAAKNGERAVAIFEKYLPPSHSSLLGSMQNLAAFRSLSASIGKMFPNDDTFSEESELTLPDGHPAEIFQSLERAWQRAKQHDYPAAFEMACATRERAISYFGAESVLAAKVFPWMIAILRRHCSFFLGEPTGTLHPQESWLMQIRAHARRGIVEDDATPTPKLEPEQRAKIESLLREGIRLIREECGIEPSGESNYQIHVQHLLRDSDFASDVLEILHYARLIGGIDNCGAAEIAFQVMQFHGHGPAAEGLASAARSSTEHPSLRDLRASYRLTILERDALVRSLIEAEGREASASAAARSKLLPELEAKILDLRRQLQEAGDNCGTINGELLSLRVVQSLLRPDEAVLSMLVGSRAIFLIAATQYDIAFKRVEIEVGLVREMCEAVIESTMLQTDEAVPDFDLSNALQIYNLVLDPVRDRLESVSHLLFVPDGPLWSVPLQCLVVDPVDPWDTVSSGPNHPGMSSPLEDDDKGEVTLPRFKRRAVAFSKWLGTRAPVEALSIITRRRLWVADRYAVSVMPSLVPLLDRSSIVSADDRRPFLGIGDPMVSHEHSSGIAAVPETRQILSSFAIALNADSEKDIILGSAATLDRLIDLSESGELASRRVLCFATHATYPRDDGDPLTESGLVFSSGEILTAFDVVGLRINADLVLLTACFTGAPSGRSITVPLSGLAQAFLKAGARSLLVSHWPVDAEATELFAVRFAEALAANHSLVNALQSAEEHVRGQARYSQPAFWSGFSIIGDGAKVVGRL